MVTNHCLFLPRSSLGTSDDSSLIFSGEKYSQTAPRTESTHGEALNLEGNNEERGREVSGGDSAVLPVTCSSPPLLSGQCIRVLVDASPLG